MVNMKQTSELIKYKSPCKNFTLKERKFVLQIVVTNEVCNIEDKTYFSKMSLHYYKTHVWYQNCNSRNHLRWVICLFIMMYIFYMTPKSKYFE